MPRDRHGKDRGGTRPAALAYMALGGWLRARVRPEAFRLCFFLGLLALGAELV